MSPQLHHPELLDTDSTDMRPLSDMRRVSLSLAFAPARHRRRRQMNTTSSWLKTRLGIHHRRRGE